jgi:DNA-directed RNA polymerase specialized sigma24 family protein
VVGRLDRTWRLHNPFLGAAFLILPSAIRNFAPSHGVRFSGYFAAAIRREYRHEIRLDRQFGRGGHVPLARYESWMAKSQHADVGDLSVVAQETGLNAGTLQRVLGVRCDFEDDLSEMVAARPGDVGRSLCREEMVVNIRRVLDELSPKQQFVIRHAFGVDGAELLSGSEIGVRMSLSRGAVNVRLHVGLKAFKLASRRLGLDKTLAGFLEDI